MYEELRNQIDVFISNQRNCCSIGCSHCCYQTIELLDIEFETVKRAIENLDDQNKRIVLKNLEDYWVFFNQYTPNDRQLGSEDVFTLFQKLPKGVKTKCPLLIDNKCSIYENRPLTCRIHIVENSPEHCNADPYRDSAEIASQFRSSIIYHLRKTKEIELKPLAHLISETIDPNRKLKPVVKITLPKL